MPWTHYCIFSPSSPSKRATALHSYFDFSNSLTDFPASTLIPLKAYFPTTARVLKKKKKTRSYYSRTWNLLIGFHALRIKHILFAIAILFSYHPLLPLLSSIARGSSYSPDIPGSFLFQNFCTFCSLCLVFVTGRSLHKTGFFLFRSLSKCHFLRYFS